jgi:predicted N-formylglutamate amidohydrolase
MSQDFQAFDTVNLQGDPRLLIVCDHASNSVPPGYGTLGLPPEEFERHIAYDIGVDGLTRALAARLDCPAVLSCFSRLVIDPNRGEDDPTLIMKLSDGAIIPGNKAVDDAETARRLSLCHRPYHTAIDTAIQRSEAETGRGPNIISIHSFTRQLQGRSPRPWHLGVLYDWDHVTADALLETFRTEADLCIGDNEPYTGKLEGDCMWRHATQRKLPHALLEVRNDLIEVPETQKSWAQRLAPHIEAVFADNS